MQLVPSNIFFFLVSYFLENWAKRSNSSCSLELMGWVDALMFVSAIGGIHLGVFQEMTVTDSKYFLL
uniref:Uncharacterized protein n=1 Tax=Vitis vinifera TaxID=29760 RepID=F6GVL3_VITVI